MKFELSFCEVRVCFNEARGIVIYRELFHMFSQRICLCSSDFLESDKIGFSCFALEYYVPP